MFEQAARDHAIGLAAAGELSAEMTVGRWWRDEVAEIDVLGLLDGRARLVGEARWQADPLDQRDLSAQRSKTVHLPGLHPHLEFALWSRGGATPDVSAQPGVLTFTADDMV